MKALFTGKERPQKKPHILIINPESKLKKLLDVIRGISIFLMLFSLPYQ